MKKLHIIGIVMIGLAIAAIITAMGDTSSYVGFDEAYENPEKQFHVVGVLDESKEMEYNPSKDPNYFSFYMLDDKGNSQKVVYHDGKPQDFEKSEQIVIVGRMNNDQFDASKILMKCPSKYEEDEIKYVKE